MISSKNQTRTGSGNRKQIPAKSDQIIPLSILGYGHTSLFVLMPCCISKPRNSLKSFRKDIIQGNLCVKDTPLYYQKLDPDDLLEDVVYL